MQRGVCTASGKELSQPCTHIDHVHNIDSMLIRYILTERVGVLRVELRK